MTSIEFHADRGELVKRLRAAGCVFAEEEAELLVAAADSPGRLADLVERRAAGLPLEHLLGWAEFCGLRVGVDPGVFVPRARTALLVEAAAAVTRPGAAVLDLCCGSGAAALVLAGRLAPRWLAAVDLDPAAVACARRNLGPLGVPVYQGDLYEPVPARWRGRLDLIVANVPYVPTREVALMPPEARLHEAPVALDGGPDGLAVLRRVAEGAADWLAPGGHLVVEAAEGQVDALCATLTGLGLTPSVVRDEEIAGTAVTARRG
jgi:release factor glutamine methyltransferase